MSSASSRPGARSASSRRRPPRASPSGVSVSAQRGKRGAYVALWTPRAETSRPRLPPPAETAGKEPGDVSTGQMVAALRKLGFKYVFDTNFGADLTIMEEATELIGRLVKDWTGEDVALPMFTSCCPAWINFVEKERPDLIPHLSSCKSPQQMVGAVVKNIWAQRLGYDPEDVVMVSIMPCVAKKGEADRPEFAVHDADPSLVEAMQDHDHDVEDDPAVILEKQRNAVDAARNARECPGPRLPSRAPLPRLWAARVLLCRLAFPSPPLAHRASPGSPPDLRTSQSSPPQPRPPRRAQTSRETWTTC